MQTKNWIFPLPIMMIFLLLVCSCKKKNDSNNPTPTQTPETVTDIDGNLYHTVTICSQLWMVENLKTTRYNDGSLIPLVTDSAEWVNSRTPRYCWYNNDTAYKSTYGALYNWYAVNTGKLAPTDWHIPTYEEWTVLITCLGGDSVAGGKLKETGTSHWHSPNLGATNQTGFTAVPGGYREGGLGSFGFIGFFGCWWNSTELRPMDAWSRYMWNNDSSAIRCYYDELDGFSVRCIWNKKPNQ
jgi:uncharacterized protein (TIGR02145 family)